jgi:type I restriction enzyme R subunit
VVTNGVETKIEPIDILSTNFKDEHGKETSSRAKALDMEQALRYHLNLDKGKNGARKRKLSKQLEDILQQFKDRWDEMLAALQTLADEAAKPPSDEGTGLDPETQMPFLWELAEAVHGGAKVSKEEAIALAKSVPRVLELIREYLDRPAFWESAQAQEELYGVLYEYLDDSEHVPLERRIG